MTTETLPHTPKMGVRVLLGAVRTSAIAASLVILTAALTRGAPEVWGALVGAALAIGVLALGAFTVEFVAAHLPAASLLIALLTYSLEVVVLGVVFWRLSGSDLLDHTWSATWLGVAVIAATFGWLVGQVVLTMRARIPAYDLPVAPAPGAQSAGAR